LDIADPRIISNGGPLEHELVFPVGMLGLDLVTEVHKDAHRLFKVSAAGRALVNATKCVKASVHLEKAKRLTPIAKTMGI
jgi:hypothetical protein